MKTIRSCLFTFILLCLGLGALCFRNQISKISSPGYNGDVYHTLRDQKNSSDIVGSPDTTNAIKADLIKFMPSQSYLNDNQIDDILNFVHNNCGNKTPHIKPETGGKERISGITKIN